MTESGARGRGEAPAAPDAPHVNPDFADCWQSGWRAGYAAACLQSAATPDDYRREGVQAAINYIGGNYANEPMAAEFCEALQTGAWGPVIKTAAGGRPQPEALEKLLTEWDREVSEHGIWTSGHSIAARLVAAIREQAASTRPPAPSAAGAPTCDYHVHRMRCNQCAQDFNIVLPPLPTDHQHEHREFGWRRISDPDGVRWFWVQRCACGHELVGKPDTGPIDQAAAGGRRPKHRGDLVRLVKQLRAIPTLAEAVDRLADFMTPNPDPVATAALPSAQSVEVGHETRAGKASPPPSGPSAETLDLRIVEIPRGNPQFLDRRRYWKVLARDEHGEWSRLVAECYEEIAVERLRAGHGDVAPQEK